MVGIGPIIRIRLHDISALDVLDTTNVLSLIDTDIAFPFPIEIAWYRFDVPNPYPANAYAPKVSPEFPWMKSICEKW